MRRSLMLLLPSLALGCALMAAPANLSAQKALFSTQASVMSSPGADTRAASAEVNDAFRRLGVAQEAHRELHGKYAQSVADLAGVQLPGAVLLTMTAGTDNGMPWWSAAALHQKAPASTWKWSNRPSAKEVRSEGERIPIGSDR